MLDDDMKLVYARISAVEVLVQTLAMRITIATNDDIVAGAEDFYRTMMDGMDVIQYPDGDDNADIYILTKQFMKMMMSEVVNKLKLYADSVHNGLEDRTKS